MKNQQLLSLMLITLWGACLGSCASSFSIMQPAPMKTVVSQEKTTKIIPSQVALSISLPDDKGQLNAEVTKPAKKSEPKTLVILVPGSGKVSRRGEVEGDGLDTYESVIESYNLWAQSLSEQGFFVLAYDKRTCDSNLCKKNPTKDIDELGIKALSNDLDAVYQFVIDKLAAEGEKARVFLLTTAQGAQVVAQADCSKLVQGTILLSPIVGALEEALTGGYARAQEQKKQGTRKNRFMNKAEEIKAFFVSLKKKGMFPENAQIRGASTRFWHSWMEASLKTLDMLLASKRPVLALFSDEDVFSAKNKTVNITKNSKNKSILQVKSIEHADRNFINNNQLAGSALKAVADFIKKSK